MCENALQAAAAAREGLDRKHQMLTRIDRLDATLLTKENRARPPFPSLIKRVKEKESI